MRLLSVIGKLVSVRAAGRLNLWLPVVLWMSLIFYSSSLPGRDLPELFIHQDIVFHLLAYLLLGYLFSRAAKETYQFREFPGLIIFTVVFCLLYGIIDELHQLFVPGRECSAMDVLVDGTGGLLGGIIVSARSMVRK
ncbi:MAG: VanZ family protein [Candidatus Omnitrophica bacterium]|nr:VanZ family protein [Candidatus Omnitrophota bacterium]